MQALTGLAGRQSPTKVFFGSLARKRGLAQGVFHVLTVGEGHARLAQRADRLPVALQGGWGACP